EELGFGPCHHMEEVFRHREEVPTWERAARGEKVDWVAFLAPWGSTCDFPSSFYWQELAEAFPDAKIVLTLRDEAAWYKSFHDTIYELRSRFPTRLIGRYLPFVSVPFRVTRPMGGTLGGDFGDRDKMMAAFRAHNEKVRATLPPERLLVFEVQQ